MSEVVVQFRKPSVAEQIVADLAAATDTDELYVLRAFVDEDGVKQLEWFTTECDSKIWSVGALHYVAHRLMEWENEPEHFSDAS